MAIESFSLKPFKQNDKYTVKCRVDRREHSVYLEFFVSGNIGELIVPPFSAHALRKNDLWKSTCFEVFFREKGKAAYFEYNLCPSGDWNLFHFEDYREGKSEYLSAAPKINFLSSDQNLNVQINLNLALLDRASSEGGHFDLWPTCILKTISGELSYWAISYFGKEPDFHLPPQD